MTEAPPIIVTAQFDPEADAFFQRRREQFFPPQLNFIPAHLTLFHNLPGERERDVLEGVGTVAADYAAFSVTVSELMPLGRGVAYKIQSDDLKGLRRDLASRFDDMLVKQDRQGFRAHVTIQNKVTPQEARGTRAILERDFQPFPARIEGIQLWHYQGGPWSPIAALALPTP